MSLSHQDRALLGACKGDIEDWWWRYKINPLHDQESPLCNLNTSCDKCPIGLYTDGFACDGTPYYEWNSYVENNCGYTDDGAWVFTGSIGHLMRLAKAEYEFLLEVLGPVIEDLEGRE